MVRPAAAAAKPTASAVADLGFDGRAVDEADLHSGRHEDLEQPGRVGRPDPDHRGAGDQVGQRGLGH